MKHIAACSAPVAPVRTVPPWTVERDAPFAIDPTGCVSPGRIEGDRRRVSFRTDEDLRITPPDVAHSRSRTLPLRCDPPRTALDGGTRMRRCLTAVREAVRLAGSA